MGTVLGQTIGGTSASGGAFNRGADHPRLTQIGKHRKKTIPGSDKIVRARWTRQAFEWRILLPPAYKYDAALSFAGEDRKHAESLNRLLTKRGYSIFYDAKRRAHLWGKTARDFEKAYGPQTRFVIPFVSRHYPKKDWTRFEFDAAKREERKRGDEFILPIRIDDTTLFGLHDDVIRLDLRETRIEEIARLFDEKCREIRTSRGKQNGPRVTALTLGLLKPEARRALELIASASVPLPRIYFERLFPKFQWILLIKRFRRAGLIRIEDNIIRLSEMARKSLRGDESERKALNRVWIDQLTALEANIDAGAFLALHMLSEKRLEDAARVVVNIANYGHLGGWNRVYLSLLTRLMRRKLFPRLTRDLQVKILNALGRCLTDAGRYSEALKTYDRLRRLSTKYRDTWGVGQSYINAGVAAHGNGDDSAAQKFYNRAIRHGRTSRDSMLLGRALGNLSQLCQDSDLPKAERLLEESFKAKADAKDWCGLITAMGSRGNLAATRGDFAAPLNGSANPLAKPHAAGWSTRRH